MPKIFWSQVCNISVVEIKNNIKNIKNIKKIKDLLISCLIYIIGHIKMKALTVKVLVKISAYNNGCNIQNITK